MLSLICRTAPAVRGIYLTNLRPLSTSRTLGDKYFAKSHEWVSVEGGIGTVGISEHAQDALGDVVYVDLPEVGQEVEAVGQAGTVESVKAASDVMSPVTGTITEANEALSDTPGLINKACYGDGWLFKLKLTNEKEVNTLMDESSYDKFLKTLDD